MVNPVSKPKLGLSTTSTDFGALTPADEKTGVNWLINNGGTSDDLNKFQIDREFQAWVLKQGE